MRFDLEKFERENPELAVTLHQNPRFFVRAAVEAAETALLAPSPCGVEGHRKANGHFHIDQLDRPSERLCHCDMPEAQRKVCAVCAELSRVRQQERAAALEQAVKLCEDRSNEVRNGAAVYGEERDPFQSERQTAHLETKKLAEQIRALIPAEAQGASDKAWFDALAKLEPLIESRVSERTKRLREALAELLAECDHPDWDYKWSRGEEAELLAKCRTLESE